LFGSQTYVTGVKDASDSISKLLDIDASQLRAQRLATLLDTRLEFEPRRRQDVQFIFLAARADDARLIQPHIRSHALDLPVLATSQVYQPGQSADADLDGISFDDMPWALEDSGPVADTRAAIAQAWPNNFADNSRFYALGYDAYRLVPLLYNTHGIAQPVQGVTGVLSLDTDGRVHRRLDWASFDQGEPELLAPISMPAPPVLTAPAGTP
jgi:outer membrane PBP1 activator LpoA protein